MTIYDKRRQAQTRAALCKCEERDYKIYLEPSFGNVERALIREAEREARNYHEQTVLVQDHNIRVPDMREEF